MGFGIFDHLDDSGAPLGRHFEDRLNLIEAYVRCDCSTASPTSWPSRRMG